MCHFILAGDFFDILLDFSKGIVGCDYFYHGLSEDRKEFQAVKHHKVETAEFIPFIELLVLLDARHVPELLHAVNSNRYWYEAQVDHNLKDDERSVLRHLVDDHNHGDDIVGNYANRYHH